MDEIPAYLHDYVERIKKSEHSEYITILNELRKHVEQQQQQQQQEPPRKVAKTAAAEKNNDIPPVNLDRAIVLKDISVAIPERKKTNLVFTSTAVHVVKELEQNPFNPDHSFPLSEIDLFFSAHVPEKTKPQFSVILFNGPTALLQFTLMDIYAEQVLRFPSPVEDRKDVKVLDLLVYLFTNNFQKKIVQSSPTLCVSAHRGSKEGYLYLLDGYVFFGFKKPLLLFNLNDIESISYSSIIRVTFNMTIKLVKPLPEFPNQFEYEFSMIDQGEYDKIDKYVVENELSNQSMSEARRARISAKDIVSNEIKKVMEEEGVDLGEQGDGQDPAAASANRDPNDSSDDEELDQDYQDSSGSDSGGSGSESESGSGSDDEDGGDEQKNDEEEEADV